MSPKRHLPSTLAPSRIKALLIEDNEADIKLARYAFQDQPFDFLIARDGVTGFEMAQKHQPQLIFLDMNLPRMHGDEVLRCLKANADTAHIPVIMLTNSENPDHVMQAYDLQVASYCNKPVDLETFTVVAERMGLYWVDTIVLPPAR